MSPSRKISSRLLSRIIVVVVVVVVVECYCFLINIIVGDPETRPLCGDHHE